MPPPTIKKERKKILREGEERAGPLQRGREREGQP
jgi:hypothetical protein